MSVREGGSSKMRMIIRKGGESERENAFRDTEWATGRVVLGIGRKIAKKARGNSLKD